MTDYRKDFPSHLFAEEHLNNRLRSIFRPISWCETLFQRTEFGGSTTLFGQKLISAAANFDLCSKLHPRPVTHYHVTHYDSRFFFVFYEPSMILSSGILLKDSTSTSSSTPSTFSPNQLNVSLTSSQLSSIASTVDTFFNIFSIRVSTT